jgi:hypothetical protein
MALTDGFCFGEKTAAGVKERQKMSLLEFLQSRQLANRRKRSM